jgi:hypothetical protein
MRVEGLRLEFRVELDADEPGVVRPFDDLGQSAVGAHAREQQPALLQRRAVVDIDLVAVAVALADVGRAVDGGDMAVAGQRRFVGAQPHGAAEVAVLATLLEALPAHPLGDEADDRLLGLAELGRARAPQPCGVPGAFDAGHLHAEADAEEGHAALAGELDGCDLAFEPRSPKPPGTRMPWSGSSWAGMSASGCSNNSASSQEILTLTRLAMPPWTSASVSDL